MGIKYVTTLGGYMTRNTSSKNRTSRAKSLLKRAVNGSTSSSPTRSRSRTSRSKSSSASPRSRARRSSTSFLSTIPGWVPISLGVASVCGLIYGLMQLDSVSDFMDPVIHDVGEFFGLSDDEGIDSKNLTHDRIYGGVSA